MAAYHRRKVGPLAACMSLNVIICTHRVRLASSSAAFVRITPSSSSNRVFGHQRFANSIVGAPPLVDFIGAGDAGRGSFSGNASCGRRMSTSLKDSIKGDGGDVMGLSDIGGQSTNNREKDGDVDDINRLLYWKERIDISIAKSRKIRGSNYVQISTVDYDTMEPRCRTVVFRGFLKGVPVEALTDALLDDNDGARVAGEEAGGKYQDCVMKMITDRRSNKVRELEASKKNGGKIGNTVEMVWWFPKSSEQYRVRGRLQFIGSDGPFPACKDSGSSEQIINHFLSERKQQWGNLSDMAREQFFWENPGVPFTSEEEQAGGVPPGGRDADGKVLPPPDTFLLMLLYPAKIDYLRLGDNFRQVDEWDWENDDFSAGQWKSLRVNP